MPWIDKNGQMLMENRLRHLKCLYDAPVEQFLMCGGSTIRLCSRKHLFEELFPGFSMFRIIHYGQSKVDSYTNCNEEMAIGTVAYD